MNDELIVLWLILVKNLINFNVNELEELQEVNWTLLIWVDRLHREGVFIESVQGDERLERRDCGNKGDWNEEH